MPMRFSKHLSPKTRRELERQLRSRQQTTLLDHLRANRRQPVYLPGMSGLGEQVFSEAEQNAKAADIMRKAPPTELYDKQPMGAGWFERTRAIPKVIQFHSRAGNKLIDIPLDLREGVKREIVESYGVAAEDADKIATQAVDRWIEMSERTSPPTTSYKAEVIERSSAPAFSVESVPGNMGELPAATEQITRKYEKFGWKQLVPLAVVGGLVVLLLKKK